MLTKIIIVLVIINLGKVRADGVENMPFWDLTATKTWSSAELPKQMDAGWHLGLATFSSAIDKHSRAVLNMTPTSMISLNYFSIVNMFDNSKITLNDGSLLELKDQSEFSARESSLTQLDPGSSISLQGSRIIPGTLNMEPGSKITLSDSKLTSLLSSFTMQADSSLKADSRSQIAFIGGSRVDLGKGSNVTLSRCFLDVAADIHVGEKCTINLHGTELSVISGALHMGNKVELKAESRAAFVMFSASVTFTEGAKITLANQAEFHMERGSSLIMARRDLRLKIEEKGLLKIESSAHCLMTDDLTVTRQTSKTYNSQTQGDSFRCFPTLQGLTEEKQRNFPDN